MKKKKRKAPEAAEVAASGAVEVAEQNASDDVKSKKGKEGEPEKGKSMPRKWYNASQGEGKRLRELEQRNSSKYHYLKFIEKQKVERKLKSCRGKLEQAVEAGDKAAAKAAREEMKSTLADHEYVTHYPKHLPYNALFPKDDNEASQRRRAQVRTLIKEKLAAMTPDERAELEEKEMRSHRASENEHNNVGNSQEASQAAKKRKKKEKARLKRKMSRDAASGKTEVSEEVTAESEFKKGTVVAERDAAAELPAKKLKPLKAGKDRNSADVEIRSPAGTVIEAHPSWKASKSPKLSGSLVEAEGERKVFESDDESDE